MAIVAIVLMGYQFLRLRMETPVFAAIEDVAERKETLLTYLDSSMTIISSTRLLSWIKLRM